VLAAISYKSWQMTKPTAMTFGLSRRRIEYSSYARIIMSVEEGVTSSVSPSKYDRFDSAVLLWHLFQVYCSVSALYPVMTERRKRINEQKTNPSISKRDWMRKETLRSSILILSAFNPLIHIEGNLFQFFVPRVIFQIKKGCLDIPRRAWQQK